MLWFRFCLWINFYFAFSHGNLWQTKSKQGYIYIKHFRPRKTLNHYAFTRYFSDEILWSHEVINFDHLYSVVLITLNLWLFFKRLLFFLVVCAPNTLLPCFSRLVTKEEMCGKKKSRKASASEKKILQTGGLKKKKIIITIMHRKFFIPLRLFLMVCP